jgi:DNA cross-link repair 1A protein
MDIDELYLDTTYLDPRYKFPSQKECINNVIKVINEHPEKKIIFGSYSIGKEKLLLKVFENFARQIYSPGEKIRYYRAMGVDYAFTDKKENARFSVYNMPVLGHFYKRLENSDFIIIVPRGFGVDRKSIPGKVYYIPYSEHSSYDELIHFLDIVKTDKIYDLTGKPVTFQKELC